MKEILADLVNITNDSLIERFPHEITVQFNGMSITGTIVPSSEFAKSLPKPILKEVKNDGFGDQTPFTNAQEKVDKKPVAWQKQIQDTTEQNRFMYLYNEQGVWVIPLSEVTIWAIRNT